MLLIFLRGAADVTNINSDINILVGLSDFRLAGFLLQKNSHTEEEEQANAIVSGIKTQKSLKRFEKAIRSTLIHFANPLVAALVQSVLLGDRNEQEISRVLFWNASFNNELLDYLNRNLYFPALYGGRAAIKSDESLACLQDLKHTEPALQNWSDDTIRTTARKYLSLLKKFDLMQGGVKKTLSNPSINDHLLILFVYWLAAIEPQVNMLASRWLIYSFMEKELFVQLVMQKKFMKFWNVTYSGDLLRLEPTLKYEELYDELAQS